MGGGRQGGGNFEKNNCLHFRGSGNLFPGQEVKRSKVKTGKFIPDSTGEVYKSGSVKNNDDENQVQQVSSSDSQTENQIWHLPFHSSFS